VILNIYSLKRRNTRKSRKRRRNKQNKRRKRTNRGVMKVLHFVQRERKTDNLLL
jgi:hypothetical protein